MAFDISAQTEVQVEQLNRAAERVCFVIDSNLTNSTRSLDGGETLGELVKRCIMCYVARKAVNRGHQFSATTFTTSSNELTLKWLHAEPGFTSSVEQFNVGLDHLLAPRSVFGEERQEDGQDNEDEVDLGDLWAKLADELTKRNNLQMSDNSHITRVIFLHGRSYCVPIASKSVPDMFKSPFFYLDVLYIHRKMNDEGVCCQDIFDCLASEQDAILLASSLPERAFYTFETVPTALRLLSLFVALLSHAQQRELQSEALEKLNLGVE